MINHYFGSTNIGNVEELKSNHFEEKTSQYEKK